MNAPTDIAPESCSIVARLAAVTVLRAFRAESGRMLFFSILAAGAGSAREKALLDERVQYAKAAAETGLEAIAGTGQVPGCEREALNWLRRHARAVPDLISMTRDFTEQGLRISAMQVDDPMLVVRSVQGMIDQSERLFSGPFHKLLTALGQDLQDLKVQRHQMASAAAKSSQSSMNNIANISRSVRLISLNASVEAARVGEHGRGFSVIAAEIKLLAEAIDTASQSADESMHDLLALIEMD